MSNKDLNNLFSGWQGRQGRPVKNKNVTNFTQNMSQQPTKQRRKNTPMKKMLEDLQILQSISENMSVPNNVISALRQSIMQRNEWPSSSQENKLSNTIATTNGLLQSTIMNSVIQNQMKSTPPNQQTFVNQPNNFADSMNVNHNMFGSTSSIIPNSYQSTQTEPIQQPIVNPPVQVIAQKLPQSPGRCYEAPSQPIYKSTKVDKSDLYRLAFLELPWLFYIIDAKSGFFSDVNNIYTEVVGFTIEEQTKKHYKDIINNADYYFASGLHRQFLRGEISSFSITTDVKCKIPRKGVFALNMVSILDRDKNGMLNNFIIFGITTDLLYTSLLNCCKLGNWDAKSLEPLTDSLIEITENIRKHKQEKSFESKRFQHFNNMNIACIVCKLQLSEMIIIFGNKKINQLGLQNIVGKNLKTVLDNQSFEKVEKFVNQKLSFVEFVGQFSTASHVFRIHAFWMGQYIVFHMNNTIILAM